MSNQNPGHQNVIKEPADNASIQLQHRIAVVLDLPETVSVKAFEQKFPENTHSSAKTRITICFGENHSHEYVIAKPLAGITEEDIESLRVQLHVKPTFFGQLFRFFGWWLGFTGLYAMFAVCPFCGQQGCPVGVSSAGVVGGFFALVVQNGRGFLRFITRKLFGAD